MFLHTQQLCGGSLGPHCLHCLSAQRPPNLRDLQSLELSQSEASKEQPALGSLLLPDRGPWVASNQNGRRIDSAVQDALQGL